MPCGGMPCGGAAALGSVRLLSSDLLTLRKGGCGPGGRGTSRPRKSQFRRGFLSAPGPRCLYDTPSLLVPAPTSPGLRLQAWEQGVLLSVAPCAHRPVVQKGGPADPCDAGPTCALEGSGVVGRQAYPPLLRAPHRHFTKYIFSLYREPLCLFYFITDFFLKVGSARKARSLPQGLRALPTEPATRPPGSF